MKPAKWSSKWTLIAWTFGLGLLFAVQSLIPAVAEDDGTYQCGVRLFKSADYRNAIKYFQAALKDAPYDARIIYYEGLCYHKMGQIASARSCYQQVVDKFPDSDAAELAKQGLGVVDYGSGYDRPGGSLAKLDRLRMDIVPAAVTLNCQEKSGRPVVDVSVDGKKIAFVVDSTAPNTFIGTDLVRANGLNDVSLSAKAAKAAKAVKVTKDVPGAKEGKDAKDARDFKDSKDSKDSKTTVDVKASAAGKDAQGAKDVKDAQDSKATADLKQADGKDTKDTPDKTETLDQNSKDTKDIKDNHATQATPATRGTQAAPPNPPAAATQDTGAAKNAKEAQSETNKVGDAAVVLYDLIVGPVERPGFPVLITPAKPKQAVLGRDFLGPYKVTFNSTAKTLSLVRDHAFDNPFAAGMVLFDKGKYNQAVPLLKRASENRPSDPRPLYCYGSALQRAGSLEAARLVFKQIFQRFPNSEANFYATASMNAIDPSYMKEMKLVHQDAEHPGVTQKKKNAITFDLPYSFENGSWIKVPAKIDNKPIDVYLDLKHTDMQLSSGQLSAIDPSYLYDLQEVSNVTDYSTNYMWTVVTKKGYIRKLELGNAEKDHVPMSVIDQGGLKYQAAWTDQTPRIQVPILLFNDWKYVFMDDLKVIRFTKLSGSPQSGAFR